MAGTRGSQAGPLSADSWALDRLSGVSWDMDFSSYGVCLFSWRFTILGFSFISDCGVLGGDSSIGPSFLLLCSVWGAQGFWAIRLFRLVHGRFLSSHERMGWAIALA